MHITRELIQKLNLFLSRLQKLAEEFNVAVILTNQVQADPGVSSLVRFLADIRLPPCK